MVQNNTILVETEGNIDYTMGEVTINDLVVATEIIEDSTDNIIEDSRNSRISMTTISPRDLFDIRYR